MAEKRARPLSVMRGMETFWKLSSVPPELIRRNRSAIQDGIEDDRAGAALERKMACGHLIQHAADREQIGADIELLTTRLLGRHVRDGADRSARTGEMFGSADRLCDRGTHAG